MSVLAIDIGGTKLAAAVVAADGRVLARDVTRTDPADPWPGLVRLLERLAPPGTVEAVGAGCGGPMSWPSGQVSPLNIPGWREFPLRDRLAERYPGVPVRVHNDAVAFAVGEHWCGAGRGVDDMVGVVVSTGVGGGVIAGGRLLEGATGNAGHVGHVVADPDGPACPCGGRGCLEAIARGPAAVAWAREQGSAAEDGRSLARLAADGEDAAVRALARSGTAVGRVLASVVAVLDARLVVVGGGLAESGPALWEPLQAAFAAQAGLPYLAGVRVVKGALGGDAGLVGAAALVLAGDRYWSPADGQDRLGR